MFKSIDIQKVKALQRKYTCINQHMGCAGRMKRDPRDFSYLYCPNCTAQKSQYFCDRQSEHPILHYIYLDTVVKKTK